MKINEISENISHTSKRLRDIERNKGVKPGTEEWFKLWFSLPYLKESALSEAYKMQLERADDMYILHILDTKTNQRTEVRGKSGYESGNYDSDDRLHKLLDVIGKSANISELMNGEVVTINPKHPHAAKATAVTDVAFNEGAYDSITFKQKRQKLNVPYLIQKGAIYITDPHGPDGWEPDSEGFSLLTLYNVEGGGWQGEAKQHLKPSEYANAAKMINAPLPASGNNHLVYDGKYNQILWSIEKLGLGKEAFLGNVNETAGSARSKIMKISDLTISDAGVAIATAAGGGSRTDAPLNVTKLPSGHVWLINGYHRLIDAMKAGKDTVPVEFVPFKRVEILWKNEREEDIKYGKQFNESAGVGRVRYDDDNKQFGNSQRIAEITEEVWNEKSPLENLPYSLDMLGKTEANMIQNYNQIKKAKKIDRYSAAMLIAAQPSVTKAIIDYKMNNTPITGENAKFIVATLNKVEPSTHTFYRGVEREDYDDKHIMPFQSWAGNIDAARWFGNVIYQTVGPAKAVEVNHIDYWHNLLFGNSGSTGLGDNQNEYFILPKKVKRIE